ncbi:MAG: MBOAT family O-acyltransferase, partial [Bacteriovorax sp.]
MVCSRRWPQYKRTSLMVGIGFLLLHLFFWKYAGGIARSIGYDYYLPLPVGISFFTLQGIAYLVDLTDDETPVMSFFEFFLFKSFFCQLIAGPIIRAKEFLPQIQNLLQPNIEQIVEGFLLFSLGLFKKLIIADYMKLFVDVVFADPVKFSRSTLWLGAISFSIQIWGDFSGYTDLGRGCAKMLGIHLPHNFKSHSFSKRPSELWQRWHVTLSRWIKDYIYKPLIKRGKGAGWRTFSILVTFVVVGLWHGATLNFLLYGLFMGGIYLLDKLFQGKLGPSRPSSSPAMVMLVIATVMTYLLNTIG